jgi:hypothetical protein
LREREGAPAISAKLELFFEAPMRSKSAAPSREKIAQAKLLYDSGVAPISEILTVLGMSVGQFRRFREKNNWPLRASACAAPNSVSPPPERAAPERDMIARLEDAVEREFARAESALEKHAPKTIEQSARTLASLVKTLAELKRMRRETEPGGANEDADGDRADDLDAPPRELAELRAELARRLERLGGERPAR